MNKFAGLWVPVVVSASSVCVIHCLFRILLSQSLRNLKTLPEEDATIEHLQKSGVGPGFYVFPRRPKSSSCASEEARLQRLESGPWGAVNVRARQPSLLTTLAQSLTFFLVTSLSVAYLGTLALNPGDNFLKVFHVTGAAGILAYAYGGVPDAIWFGKHFRSTAMDVIDGVLYGLITGAIFGMFWPT